MKVKAKRWINVDGVWHGPGEVFKAKSVAGYADAVEVLADEKPSDVETVNKAETPKEEGKSEEAAAEQTEKAETKAEETAEVPVKEEGPTRRRNTRKKA